MIKKESTHETGKSLYLPFKRKIQEKKLIQKRRRKSIQFTNPFRDMMDSIKNSISQITLSSAAKISLNPFYNNNTDDKETEEKEIEDIEAKDNDAK